MGKFFVKDFEDLIPEKNTSPYKRVLAIGDIHGNFTRLMSLWEKIQVTEKDFVFFLGDYFDRGNEIEKTISWILQKVKEKNIVFLCGNHEQMLIKSVAKNDDSKEWLKFWFCNGGKKTLAILKKLSETKPNIAENFLQFVKQMNTYFQVKIGGRNYFFSHAGVNPKIPLDEQNEDALLNIRSEFFNHYEGDAVIICGHTPVQALQKIFPEVNGEPFRVPNRNILMTDTGSYYPDGAISCVNILTGEFWQSDNNEEREKIMFVCSGNTCRSPMAKYIMRNLFEEVGASKKFYVDSSGCKSFSGDIITTEAAEELRKNNIPLEAHKSKPFMQEDYKNFKYIIALDENILEQAKKISGGDPENKIRLLKDFQGNEINVEDPFGTNRYPQAYEKIYLGCSALLEELLQ